MNKFSWLEDSCSELPVKACCSGIFSNSETEKIYNSVYSDTSRLSRFRTMATRTYTLTAIQT